MSEGIGMDRRLRPKCGSRGVVALMALAVAAGCVVEEPLDAPDASTGQPLVAAVEVGLGFDEPVLLVGASSEAMAERTAVIALDPVGAEERFGGRVRAVDRFGNATELEIELTLTDPSEAP